MRYLLLKQWRQNGSYNDNNGQDYGQYWAADRWDFDTDTRSAVFTAFPNGGTFQQEENLGQGPPEDYSRPTDDEFHVYAVGDTRFGVFHNGIGGVTIVPQTVIVEVTVIGCNCYGTRAGIIDVTVSGLEGAYTYRWSDGATTADRSQLAAGDYTLTVRHESGAQVVRPVRVGQNPQLILELRKEGNGLSISVSGGVGPYTYLWNDGNTEPARPQLAAGSYTCQVRDSLGCGAQISGVIDDNRFYFSHDPIELRLDAGEDYRADPSSKPGLSFVCSVYVERGYMSGNFELAGQPQEQPADRNGRTVFEVQELLEPYVECYVPPVSGEYHNAIIRAHSNFCRFYLSYQERTDDGLSNGITTSLSYLVYGGLSFEEAARGTWFSGYQEVQRPFLTWEPRTKQVTREQPEYLYFIVSDEVTTDIFRRVRVRLSNGQSQVFSLYGYNDVRRHEVYIFPYSFEALNLSRFEVGDVRVVSWEAWVINQAGISVSEVRTYRLNSRYRHTPRYLLYVNSLGGVNTLAAFGRSEQQLATKTTSSQLPRTAGYDAGLGDVQVDRKTGLSTLKVYAGPRSREQMLADQDFMLSPRVLLCDGDRLQAGTVKDRTFLPLDEDETRRLLAFDYELPRQRHYTPRLVVPTQSTVIETPPIISPENPTD